LSEPRIFLCHASEDKPRVRELYHRLKEAGYHPWLDKEDLLPGQDWRREIEKIIRDRYNIVVVCLSCNSVTKRGVVQQEIKWALDALDQTPEGAIYLIPARLEECQVPDRLSELHWVELFEPDGFGKLKQALDFELGKRQPPRQAVPSVETKVAQPPVVERRPTQPQPKAQIGQPTASERPQPLEQAARVASDKPKVEEPPPQPQPKAQIKQQVTLEGRKLFEMELVLIPAGEFLMGSDLNKDKDAQKDEQPQHRLYLPDYCIARTPVTNAEYAAFVRVAGHKPPRYWKGKQPPQGKEDHPVIDVSWRDAMAYCKWLAEVTVSPYRLPSEAEWEKAARWPDGRIYPWGDIWDPKRSNADKGIEAVLGILGVLGGTTPVGAYPKGASRLGLLDMAGNVSEWCHSLYRPYPYDAKDGREDTQAEDKRVSRGGAFYLSAWIVRCAYRGRLDPFNLRNRYVGFRMALAPGFP
jgi:formylglycine-generating enzyme required for sulfatase activity